MARAGFPTNTSILRGKYCGNGWGNGRDCAGQAKSRDGQVHDQQHASVAETNQGLY